jgi:hypothetical protein
MYMYMLSRRILTNSGLGIELQKANGLTGGVTDLIYLAA